MKTNRKLLKKIDKFTIKKRRNNTSTKGFDHKNWLETEINKIKNKKTNKLSKIFDKEPNNLINIYFNEPFQDYQFEESFLYTEAFVRKLKENLGCPKKFIKSNKTARKKRADNINQLFLIEDKFKTTLRRSLFNNTLLNDDFSKEKKFFEEIFIKMLQEKCSNKNINRQYFQQKILEGMESLIADLIQLDVIPILFQECFDRIEIKEKFLENISRISGTIFNDIVKIFLQKAYSNLTKNELEDRVLDLDSLLVIKRGDLVYGLVSEIMQSLFITFSTVFEELGILESEKIDDIESSFLNHIQKNKKKLSKKSYYKIFITLTLQVVDLFTEAVVKDKLKLKLKNKKHSEIYLTLPFKFQNKIPHSMHLPEIIPPKDWNIFGQNSEQNSFDLVKSLNFGETDITFDEKTILAINLTQQKQFKINENFLELLLTMDKSKDLNIDLPFPTLMQIIDQKEKVEKLGKLALKKSDLDIFSFVMKTEKRLKDFDYDKTKELIKNLLSLTELDFEANRYYLNQVKTLKIMNNKRQIFLTVISLAEIYINFPIFYKNFCDYRLRFYPWNWIFSRSTGFYKYLLKDFKKIKITNKGIFYLIQAYYSQNKILFEEFNNQINFDNPEKDQMLDFFKNNSLEMSKENPLYFELLKRDIIEIQKGKTSTSCLLEIDQKTSCAVFLALLLKNETLAKFANLSGKGPYDLNVYLQEKTEEFFNKKKYKSKRVLKFFKENKIGHKKAFMSFCYSQGSFGRATTWISQFEEIFGELIHEEQSELFKFSHAYQEFLNDLFPGLIPQLNALKRIFDFFLKETGKTKIKTVDGSIIYWKFDEQVGDFVRYYSFIEKQRINIRFRKSNDAKIDKKKSDRAFLAGLIHAIDGSFIRLLVLKFNEKNKKTKLNPNHDSIQISPNFVDDLYNCLFELYVDETFENLVEKVLIEPMITEIPDSKLDEFNKLVDKFNSLKQNFKIDKNNFNIKDVYRFE